MGKRKAHKQVVSEDSDSDYVPNNNNNTKKKASSSGGVNMGTSSAIVSVGEKQWSKEDIEDLVKEGIKKYNQEIEGEDDSYLDDEGSVVVGLKTYLARHRCDLDWFDSNEGDRDDLISKWVDANIVEAKYQLKKTSFLNSMNHTKLKSFRAFKKNLP